MYLDQILCFQKPFLRIREFECEENKILKNKEEKKLMKK